MKTLVKPLIWVAFFALVLGNVYLFIYGVKLSDEINFYEFKVHELRAENIRLEKKVFKFDSVTYAASLAAELDYTANNSEMIYLNQPGYAYNR